MSSQYLRNERSASVGVIRRGLSGSALRWRPYCHPQTQNEPERQGPGGTPARASHRPGNGETHTRAVTETLRERYERLHKRDSEALAADIRAIADRAAAQIKGTYPDHPEYLYDEHGLPN